MMLNGLNGGQASKPSLNGSATSTLNSLLDSVDVKVETFLGETTMTVAQLNALKAGGVVTLDAPLSELVELRVNGITIAHGELVTVGDQFGVRITSVAP